MGKINEFSRLLGDFPLIVGAGLTAETCAEQLSVADGGIVGTYFRENGVTRRPVDPMRVACFMKAVAGIKARNSRTGEGERGEAKFGIIPPWDRLGF